MCRARLAARRGLAKGSVDLGRARAHRSGPMVSLSRALVLAIVQLGDPAILKVLAKTAVVTLLVFAAGGTALYVALRSSSASTRKLRRTPGESGSARSGAMPCVRWAARS